MPAKGQYKKVCDKCGSSRGPRGKRGNWVCPVCDAYDSEKQRNADALWAAKVRPSGFTNRQARTIKSNFGISDQEYRDRLDSQNNLCALCSASLLGIKHLDHDHVTGKIRMFLCGPCNMGLGLFKDSPELLRKAATYLEEFNT